jgi:hypothetical protein
VPILKLQRKFTPCRASVLRNLQQEACSSAFGICLQSFHRCCSVSSLTPTFTHLPSRLQQSRCPVCPFRADGQGFTLPRRGSLRPIHRQETLGWENHPAGEEIILCKNLSHTRQPCLCKTNKHRPPRNLPVPRSPLAGGSPNPPRLSAAAAARPVSGSGQRYFTAHHAATEQLDLALLLVVGTKGPVPPLALQEYGRHAPSGTPRGGLGPSRWPGASGAVLDQVTATKICGSRLGQGTIPETAGSADQPRRLMIMEGRSRVALFRSPQIAEIRLELRWS